MISENEDLAIEFINEIAPEHLQIMAKNELKIVKKITSAGLTLIGENTPSAASDYCLGSNHVLPTMGFGKSRTSLLIFILSQSQIRFKLQRKSLKRKLNLISR